MSISLLHKGVVLTPEDFNGVDWVRTMHDLGLNTLGIHSGGGCPVADLPGKLDFTLTQSFRESVKEAGLQLEFELHVCSSLLPRNLFPLHPEYFMFDASKKERAPGRNFCPTNAEAMRISGKNAEVLAQLLHPDTHRYLLWGDDSSAWCRCPECHEFTDSEQALLVSNNLLKSIRKTDPESAVPYLAYSSTLPAPRIVKPSEGVFLEFAPFTRCFEHAINDPKCAVNRGQWKALLDLLQIFPAESTHILEYFLDSSLASSWKKPAKRVPFNKKIVQADIAAYRSLGIRSITTFAVYMDGDYFRRFGDRELREYAEILNQ